MANSQLYLWGDRFLWLGRSFCADFTARYAMTLVVSLSDQPIRMTLENGETLESFAVLTGPKLRRKLDASNTAFLSLNWDPHSFEFNALSQLLGDQALMCFERSQFADLAEDFQTYLQRPPGQLQVAAKCAELFRRTCPSRSAEKQRDLRVQRVAMRLRQELPRSVDAVGLAADVGVSVDYLTHLFKREIGMSMRNFLLWAKARQAVSQLLHACNITDVAHTCGFADLAHFTRSVREFFDVTPSLLTNAAEVTLHPCQAFSERSERKVHRLIPPQRRRTQHPGYLNGHEQDTVLAAL